MVARPTDEQVPEDSIRGTERNIEAIADISGLFITPVNRERASLE
jgi:hypothetical protein